MAVIRSEVTFVPVSDDSQAMDWLGAGLYRGPLRDVVIASNLVAQRFSQASAAAAENLLDKALRSLAEGDEVRANVLITRAVSLPFDEHEEVRPGRWAAHMMLYLALSEAVDESYEDDDTWFDAALAGWDEAGRDVVVEFASSMASLRSEEALTPHQLRRLNARLAPGLHEEEADEVTAATADRDVPLVREVLMAILTFERRLRPRL